MGKIFILISFAIRDASKSRIILALIIVSLAICSVAVLTTTAILDGFKATLASGAINSDGELIISPKDTPFTPIKNIDNVMEAVRKIDNVKSFSVRSYGQGGIKIGDSTFGAYAFMGFNPQYEKDVTKIQSSLIDGKFVEPNSSNEVVLGITLADALIGLEDDGRRIKTGDDLEIISLSGQTSRFKVVGIIDAKTFRPNWTAYFNKQKLEEIDTSGKNSEIVIKLHDLAKMDETKQKLLDMNLNIGVSTWKQKAGYIDSILTAVGYITNMISSLLIVAIFIILSIIVYINVSQKKRQIGIMKSMGASSSFVVSIFVLEALIYSILSFTIGTLVFVLIHLYSEANPIPLLVGDFHTVIDRNNIIFTMIILFAAALGGSFIPSFVAAKTKIASIIIDRN